LHFALTYKDVQGVGNFAATGLLTFILDDEAWADYTSAPRPANPLPTLTADAKQTARTIYDNALKDYRTIVQAQQGLLAHLESTVPLSFIQSITPTTGAFSATALQIVTVARQRYAALTHQVLEATLTSLCAPVDSTVPLDALFASIDGKYRALRRADCVTPKQFQVRFFLRSISAHPELQRAAMAYLELHPRLADQSLPALFDHLRLAAANRTAISAYDAGMVANVTGRSTSPSARPRARTPHPRQATQPSPHASPTTSRGALYCYYHGSSGHAGIACRHMLTRPETFTHAHLHATSPTLPGASTHKT